MKAKASQASDVLRWKDAKTPREFIRIESEPFLHADSQPEGTPLWLYPPKFNLDRFVFNAHRVPDDASELVVTASLWDCLRVVEQQNTCIAWLVDRPSVCQFEWLETSSASQLALSVPDPIDEIDMHHWLFELARRAPTRVYS